MKKIPNELNSRWMGSIERSSLLLAGGKRAEDGGKPQKYILNTSSTTSVVLDTRHKTYHECVQNTQNIMRPPHYLTPEHLNHPERKPYAHWAVTPQHPNASPSPWQPRIWLLSPRICLFWIIHTNGVIEWCRAFPTITMFPRFSHVEEDLTPFYGRIITHYILFTDE